MSLKFDASTADINQLTAFTSERQQGYRYFLSDDETKIAAQSILPSWIDDISSNYYSLLGSEIGSATGMYPAHFKQPIMSASSISPVCDYLYVCIGQWNYIQKLTGLSGLYCYYQISDTVLVDTIPVHPVDDSIKLELLDLFNSFDDDFNTDIDYYLTNALNNIIKENGKSVIRSIAKLINQHEINNNIIYETLRAIGRIEDEDTKSDQFEILLQSLRDDVAIIRDGAISGLSFLNDRKALPHLRILLEQETVPILRENIKVAIQDLESD